VHRKSARVGLGYRALAVRDDAGSVLIGSHSDYDQLLRTLCGRADVKVHARDGLSGRAAVRAGVVVPGNW
jgi:hypothetical protein